MDASEEAGQELAVGIREDHAQDKTFNKNFFDDWSKVLKKHPPVSVVVPNLPSALTGAVA